MHSLENRGTSSAIRIIAIAMAAAIFSQGVYADTFSKGRHVEPAFEGWRPNDDGSFNLMFGYMNENWEEEPDMAIGDKNFFSPGDADRGQPTHFLPRRNRFTFDQPGTYVLWSRADDGGLYHDAYITVNVTE